jgi:plasmid replication initiation protein
MFLPFYLFKGVINSAISVSTEVYLLQTPYFLLQIPYFLLQIPYFLLQIPYFLLHDLIKVVDCFMVVITTKTFQGKLLVEKKDEMVVVKSNEVIQASYKLSLNEQRIILAAIAKIDSMKELSNKDGVTIRVDEIKDLLVSSDMNIKGYYQTLKLATDKLYERSILLDGEGSKRRWIYEVKYNKHHGDITLFFSPTIIPYLSELKGNFTKYKLEHISQFSSVHSIRIYELLCRWSFIGEKEIEIDELKHLLGLEDKYDRPSNFVNRVLVKAVDEINQYSNMRIKFGLRKTGKRITHIQLDFGIKTGKKRLKKGKNTMANFVANNPDLTKGKSEWEVRQMMEAGKGNG